MGDFQETDLLDYEFDWEDQSAIADLDKDFSKQTDATSEEAVCSMFNPNPFNPNSGVSLPTADVPMDNSQALSETWLNEDDGNFDILQIAANDPDPPAYPSTVNTDEIRNVIDLPQTANPAAVKIEPANNTVSAAPITSQVMAVTSTARPSRPRRKSVQTSRNIQDSPMMLFHEDSVDLDHNGLTTSKTNDVKPDVNLLALVPLNGTANRNRNTSLSQSPNPSSLVACKSGDEKRKRKYEFEDDNDPSVKNAKAAKLNRDKKKRQMMDLQKQVEDLRNENNTLKQSLQESNSLVTQLQESNNTEVTSLRQQLQEERLKNSANSLNRVTMLDYMTKVVASLQPTPNLFLSERLAATPMPPMPEVQELQRRRQNGIIPQQQQNPSDSSFLMFKVGIGGTPTISIDCENRAQN